MSRALNLQSNALALDDTFYLMAWICLAAALLILVTFAKKALFDGKSTSETTRLC